MFAIAPAGLRRAARQDSYKLSAPHIRGRGYNSVMSDEDALLAAIAAHPDEDTPRLAYADWLDEYDRHVRAEFIRVQIERANIPEDTTSPADHARHGVLLGREVALHKEHHLELLGTLAALPKDALTKFHRGFVSNVDVSVHDFLAHAELIAPTRPLPAVTVTQVVERVVDFLLCPHTGCVSGIAAWSEQMRPNRVPAGGHR